MPCEAANNITGCRRGRRNDCSGYKIVQFFYHLGATISFMADQEDIVGKWIKCNLSYNWKVYCLFTQQMCEFISEQYLGRESVIKPICIN